MAGFEKDIFIELPQSPPDQLKKVYNCGVFFKRMGPFIDISEIIRGSLINFV